MAHPLEVLRRLLTHAARPIGAAVLFCVVGQAPSITANNGQELRIKVLAPDRGIPQDPVQFRWLSPPSEIANESSATLARVRAEAPGIYQIQFPLGFTGESNQLEVLTSTTRRARFQLRDLIARDGQDLPVIHLEQGVSRQLAVLDARTRRPLANTLVGPIFPAPEARPGTEERAYPFLPKPTNRGSQESRA